MESRDRGAQFEQIVTPHLTRAYNLARVLVRNEADAEDLVQEASLRAFRALDGYHGGDAKTWLLVIVRNVCYSFLGSKRPDEYVVEFQEEQHSTSTEAGSAESALLKHADSARVRGAIEELPPEFREALVLRELEECSYRQIAEITGVPIGTVMSRLSRARQLLREKLQRQAGKGARP